MALEVINGAVPSMVGGSADLTGSNLTKTSTMRSITPGNFRGNYVHFGIREHAMGAVMNGMALHGGMIPYGGTFLVFSDYMRGSMRLSALMKQRVIYVLTHDSIGLGEDGPTHQPIEHLAMLRATPNMLVFRPCDAVETAEAWEVALESTETPSVMALSRQGLPTVRTERTNENLTQKGGYILKNVRGARDITLMATGSEIAIALEAAAMMESSGLQVVVVSMPCWELFDQQSDQYRQSVLGSAPRIAVEALSGFGWDRYLRTQDVFIGMTDFGASGPAPELYEHFGITKKQFVRPLTVSFSDLDQGDENMALISLRQLLDHAAERGYGVPAFNINNMEQGLAIMKAADKLDAPVILQASRGARTYAGDPMLKAMVTALAEMYPDVPIVLHQDHGNNEATCLTAMQHGFTSVMMDGSLEGDAKTPASYEYNVDITQRVTEMAHAVGASVEGELGVLGSLETGEGEKEDGHGFEGKLSEDELLTDPDQAVDFVKRRVLMHLRLLWARATGHTNSLGSLTGRFSRCTWSKRLTRNYPIPTWLCMDRARFLKIFRNCLTSSG